METITIDFTVPKGWHILPDKQLRFIYQLLSADCSADEIKILCLFRWNGIKVIGRQPSGTYILKKAKTIFETTPMALAEILTYLDWLDTIPTLPVRISKIKRCPALPADFSEVPFETFIISDNLYQGYLQTQDDNLLDQLGATLYGKEISFKPYERISIFYWFASLKDWLGKKYSEFFQPMEAATGGSSTQSLGSAKNLLAAPSMNVEAAMNAQIRALTKGDITKEAEVLALDTHRALTELNAQACEYKELNAKTHSK